MQRLHDELGAADSPVAELEAGFLIVDVFESENAVAEFNDAMRTIPREAGIQEPPLFYATHTFISG
jgi:hypothetical protein